MMKGINKNITYFREQLNEIDKKVKNSYTNDSDHLVCNAAFFYSNEWFMVNDTRFFFTTHDIVHCEYKFNPTFISQTQMQAKNKSLHSNNILCLLAL